MGSASANISNFACFSICKVPTIINNSRYLARPSSLDFEQLAIETSKPSKSLHRILSAKGNPTMDNLTAIFNVLRKKLNVDINVKTTVIYH